VKLKVARSLELQEKGSSSAAAASSGNNISVSKKQSVATSQHFCDQTEPVFSSLMTTAIAK
jgi:hypothetical protein